MAKTIPLYEHRVKKKMQNIILKNIFFKLMKNAVFGKTIKNVSKQRDINLIITEERRNCLVSESNYHTTEFFRKFVSHKNEKNKKIMMIKPVYLVRSINTGGS